MKQLPRLLPMTAKQIDAADSVVFAVFAPFGTDRVLSEFPDQRLKAIRQHPLVKHLLDVARQGAHVSALIDLFEDDSYLVEIPANDPKGMAIHSAWKQRMSAPQSLAGFLRRTHHRFPCSTLVLAIEGHGAGYLPEIDGAAISAATTTGNGTVEWHLASDGITPTQGGAPILAVAAYPELPVESPEFLPPNLPLSTWALGAALRSAIKDGVPKPAVIHFNNCFNMSLEVLHTVAPLADFATGYANYNFFTAGETYPAVFMALRTEFAAHGPVPRDKLAKWFAEKNGALLAAKQNHPSVGATMALRRVAGVFGALNALAKELTDALKSAGGSGVRATIKDAVRDAQQFDTQQGYQLQVPDQLTDLADFAAQLKARFASGAIHDKAAALEASLDGVWQYGGFDRPWVDETQVWDFRNKRLGINILFPDPSLENLWDWRTPYYMKNFLETAKPPAQPHVIDFLNDPSGRSPWVKFLIEYHRDPNSPPPPIRLLRAKAPLFPVFDRAYKPKYPHPTDDDCGPDSPGQSGQSAGGDSKKGDGSRSR